MYERARALTEATPECLSDLLEQRALNAAQHRISVADMLELLESGLGIDHHFAYPSWSCGPPAHLFRCCRLDSPSAMEWLCASA